MSFENEKYNTYTSEELEWQKKLSTGQSICASAVIKVQSKLFFIYMSLSCNQ